jgi:hypothetical protein
MAERNLVSSSGWVLLTDTSKLEPCCGGWMQGELESAVNKSGDSLVPLYMQWDGCGRDVPGG